MAVPPSRALRVPSRPSHIPLIGRDGELALLRTAAAEAEAGRGQLALVTGESGIGKTALVRALAATVDETGIEPLWATCWEDANAPAFWPWVQLARALAQRAAPADLIDVIGDDAAEVARLLPQFRAAPLATSAEAEREYARVRFFDGATNFFCRAGQLQPLLLIVDDLQWADASSLDLLAFAVGRLHAAPVLVVGTFRDDALVAASQRSSLLRDLLPRGIHIPLLGLGGADVAALVAATTGRILDQEGASTLRARTAGNPFFVRETAQLFQSDDSHEGLPIGVRAVLDRRLAGLTPRCQSTLSAAALRHEVRLDLLEETTGHSMLELVDVATEGVRAGVLVPPTSPMSAYTFTHALMREALQGMLPSADRPEMHARIARALHRRHYPGSGVHLAEVAHHLAQAIGADGVDRREVASTCAAAAEEATGSLAYAEAAALHNQALSLLQGGAVPEEELLGPLLALGDALRRAGDGDRAHAVYSRAATVARAHLAAEELATAGLGLHQLGEVSGSDGGTTLHVLIDGLAAVGDEDSEIRALLLASIVRTRYHLQMASGEELRRIGEEAVAVARRMGGMRTLASCLMSLHDAIWGPWSGAERAAIAEEVSRLAADVQDLELAADASLARCAALLELGDPLADSEFASFERLAGSTKQRRYGYLIVSRQAMRALRWGELAEGERLSEEAERIGLELGEPDARNVRFCQLWELCSQQGRRADLVDLAMRYQGTAWATGWTGAAAVLALLDAGDEPAARRAYAVFERLDPAALPVHYGWLVTVALMAEASVAMHDSDVAGRVYDALLPHADVHVVIGGAVAYLGAVAHRLGSLAVWLDRPGPARRHFEQAIRLHERMGARAWAARSGAELGAMLANSADAEERAQATLVLQTAGEQAHEVGIMPPLPGRLGPTSLGGDNRFERQGDVWTLAYAGRVVRVKDAKGLGDLAALLAVPGREIHAFDLVSSEDGSGAASAAGLGSDPVLDRRAMQEYAERLLVLEREMVGCRDAARLERARRESDAIEQELARARGLGGRARRLDDPAERARKRVTARIRYAIDSLAVHHPELCDHLRDSVRTGSFCCYSPARSTGWQI